MPHSRASRLARPMKPEKRTNWKTHSEDDLEEGGEEDEEERSQYSEGEEEIDELDEEYQLESSEASQATESESESEKSRRTENFLRKHRQVGDLPLCKGVTAKFRHARNARDPPLPSCWSDLSD
jgi:TATA-binding protein-associated factor Taf7